jgi:hypothetical protein
MQKLFLTGMAALALIFVLVLGACPGATPDPEPAAAYTVSYNGNGSTEGTVPTDSTAYASGAAVTVKDKGDLAKTGSVFGGWNTRADGAGANYPAGSAFTITGDTTLYARWALLCRVSYDVNGGAGTVPADSTAYASGTAVTVKGKGDLAKTGLYFAGWNTKADGTGTNYVPGSAFTITADTTLYVRWVDGSPDNPIPLYGPLTSESWAALLEGIPEGAGLDLSACTMEGTEFDARPFAPDAGESKIVSLILPRAAESIKAGVRGHGHFKRFINLERVQGDNIETIGEHAFWGRTSLSEVSFPAVTSIGGEAFYGCSGLSEVSFPAVTSIGSYTFSDCSGLSAVSFPAVTSIGHGAFSGCSGLSAVSFPAVTSIEWGAFKDCTGLSAVSFPAVTSIEGAAFSGCSGLSAVSFPAVTSIQGNAFEDCSGLREVSFPVVTSIGYGAFSDTGEGVLTISLPRNAPTIEKVYSDSLTYSKAVTIRTPSDSTGYNGGWQKSFKDLFGKNSTITLIFQDL